MVLLLDFDEDVVDPASLLPEGFAKASFETTSEELPNLNINSFSAVLSCYP